MGNLYALLQCLTAIKFSLQTAHRQAGRQYGSNQVPGLPAQLPLLPHFLSVCCLFPLCHLQPATLFCVTKGLTCSVWRPFTPFVLLRV